MTSFPHAFGTKWRDGAFFDRSGSTVVVSYDQMNTAYDVDPADKDAFEAWARDVFCNDNTDPDDIGIVWD